MVLIFSNNEDCSTNEVIEWLESFKVTWFRINETDQINLKNLEFKNNQVERLVLLVNEIELYIKKCNSLAGTRALACANNQPYCSKFVSRGKTN